jgi:23S rRNA pseudouridine1911/1915/1917 synthase
VKSLKRKNAWSTGLYINTAVTNYRILKVNKGQIGLPYACSYTNNILGTLRPGIVHRLDKETSGLIIVCKNNEVHKLLKEKFENKTISKKYWTIVYGKLPNTEGVIEDPIGRHPKIGYKMAVDKVKGKPSKTSYKQLQQWRLKNGSFYTMLEIDLLTGRTHQIRVHLSSKACSVVSDPIYSHKSEKFYPDHLCLVSKQLSFVHPISNEEIKLEVELPKHMQDFISYLDKNEVKQ